MIDYEESKDLAITIVNEIVGQGYCTEINEDDVQQIIHYEINEALWIVEISDAEKQADIDSNRWIDESKRDLE